MGLPAFAGTEFARNYYPDIYFLAHFSPLKSMKPHAPSAQTDELFRSRLDEQLNMRHPLVRLAALMNWDEIERSFSVHFPSGRGRPALSPRLVAGLL